VIPGLTHHVIQRGTNRSDIFRAASDFEALLISLLRASREYELDIHSYTLMTNHFHLVVTPRTANAMSEAMRSASVSYVRYFNRKYIRTGTLFESRYRSFVIDTEEYWFTCMRYVELNPVRAGLVHSCGAYRWSSYAANALGRRDPLITPHQLYLSRRQRRGSTATLAQDMRSRPDCGGTDRHPRCEQSRRLAWAKRPRLSSRRQSGHSDNLSQRQAALNRWGF
jgi:REP element-mobilizing transposase RayT